jgi:hypothetical protein
MFAKPKNTNDRNQNNNSQGSKFIDEGADSPQLQKSIPETKIPTSFQN